MKLTEQQNAALAEYLDAHNREVARILAEGYEITKDQFMNLAHAEQRLAAHTGQPISLSEAIERAAVRFPEMYQAYRYGVTK